MDNIQEIRAELRERLSNTLLVAGALEREKNVGDEEFKTYLLGKASAFRIVLALISEGE